MTVMNAMGRIQREDMAEQMVRISEVERSISDLSDSLGVLLKRAVHLRSRLEPVLGDPKPMTGVPGCEEFPESHKLWMRIYRLRSMVDEADGVVSEIMDRLQL